MHSSFVEISARDGGKFEAYLAVPAKPRGPVVVVLQEIFGINPNIRAVADSLAARGFIAIAPDLFWRQQRRVSLDPASAADREQATALMKGLDERLAVEDSLAAASHGRSISGENGKVGVVGYCMGGKLAYLLSMEPAVDAAVSYYGVGIQRALDIASRVRAPLLLHVAEEDHLCPPEAQAAIASALGATKLAAIMSYAGAGHAFARAGGAGFIATAAARADEASAEFLKRHLEAGG
ncbi:MAG: dienelactone hydrolase family protein [Steroidobacteraceae bacterium]